MADLRISIPTLEVLKNTRTDELEEALTHVFNNNSKWAFSFILYWMKDRIEHFDENVNMDYLYGFCLDMEPIWNNECMVESVEELIEVEEIPDIIDEVPKPVDEFPNLVKESINQPLYNIKKIDKELDYSDDDEY